MIGMRADFTGDVNELRKIYESVNDEVGRAVDFKTNGCIVHTAGPIPGGWRVLDVWESQDKLDQFSQILVPILEKHGLPMTQPEIWQIENNMPGKAKS